MLHWTYNAETYQVQFRKYLKITTQLHCNCKQLWASS